MAVVSAADAPAAPVTTNTPASGAVARADKGTNTPPPVRFQSVRAIYPGNVDDGIIVTFVAGGEKLGFKSPTGWGVQGSGAGGSVNITDSQNQRTKGSIALSFEYLDKEQLKPESLKARAISRFPKMVVTREFETHAAGAFCPSFEVRVPLGGGEAWNGTVVILPRSEGCVFLSFLAPPEEERWIAEVFNAVISSLQSAEAGGKIIYPPPAPFL